MKVTIVDNGKNKTRWDYIEIGVVFRDGDGLSPSQSKIVKNSSIVQITAIKE